MRLVERWWRRSACGRRARGDLRELRGAHAASRQAAEEERMRRPARAARAARGGAHAASREVVEEERMRLVGRWRRSDRETCDSCESCERSSACG
jgi:ribosomal protein L15E